MFDILFVLFAVIIVYGGKYKDNSSSYLDYDETNAIKGIMAICILFHHISHQIVVVDNLLQYFVRAGYLIVGYFFFTSGYGMTVQFLTSSEIYRKKYIINKIKSVIIPYLIITIIYWGFDFFILHWDISIFTAIYSAFTTNYLANNCWYIVVLIYYYMFFFLAMLVARFIKINKRVCVLLFTVIYLLVYFYFISYINPGAHWTKSTISILLGVIWGCYKKTLTNKRNVIFSFTLIVYIAIKIAYGNTYGDIWFSNIVVLCFIILILFITVHVEFKNSVLSFLGKHSFEIYMIHGLVIRVLDCFNIKEKVFIFTALTIGITIVLSIPLHFLFKEIKTIKVGT